MVRGGLVEHIEVERVCPIIDGFGVLDAVFVPILAACGVGEAKDGVFVVSIFGIDVDGLFRLHRDG